MASCGVVLLKNVVRKEHVKKMHDRYRVFPRIHCDDIPIPVQLVL